MTNIVYFKSDSKNIARPFITEAYDNAEAAMMAARINERSDERNVFFVYDNDELIYASNMINEYFININDYM